MIGNRFKSINARNYPIFQPVLHCGAASTFEQRNKATNFKSDVLNSDAKLTKDCRESREPASMRPPRGPAAPPSPASASASGSAAAHFSRYAALLSLGGGGDLERPEVRDAIEAVGDRVGWANLGSNSWRSDRGLSQMARCLSNLVLPHFPIDFMKC